MNLLVKLISLMTIVTSTQAGFDVSTTSRQRRQMRNFQHPAFSMFAMHPGLSMGSSHGDTECIRDDIVCPAYCLMEDEWGCKSCPCGPANGMSPTLKEDHRESHNNEHECLGTILCMLTCKDGYKLGSRGNNGCQSCECIKKNDTKPGQEKQQECTGHACSTKSETSTPQNQKEKSDCEWPLCINGNTHEKDSQSVGPNNGPGPQSGLSPLPIGGSNSGTGGSMPGVDCIGPECSAKNGGSMPGVDCIGAECSAKNGGSMPGSGSESSCIGTDCSATSGASLPGVNCIGPECSATNGFRTMDNLAPAPESLGTASPPHTPAPKPRTCSITTEVCSRHCDGIARLGPPGHDGCPVCECVIVKEPTASPTRIYMIPPKPTAKTCPQVDQCMQSCRYGFNVNQPSDKRTCPTCECIFPMTPPPPTTSRRPNIIGLLNVCPDAVHCMKSCTSGYTLTSSPHEECPVCTCNAEPQVILLCETPLSCPNGCTVGYRCGANGCPTCTCVSPKETVLRVEVHSTVMQSALSCRPRFSCVDRCSFGYRTGGNGCPTCACLQPVTVNTDSIQLIPTHVPVYQNVDVVQQTQAPQPIRLPSSTGCLGPECSAIHTVSGGQGNLFMSAVHNSIQTQNGEKGTGSIQSVDQAYGKDLLSNAGQGNLFMSAVHNSIQTQNGDRGTGGSMQNVDQAYGKDLLSNTGIDTTARPLTAMEACPETVQCIAQCNGNFDLVPIRSSSCPACTCKDVEPSCQGDVCTNKTDKEEVLSTPSPGQCVAILHCVMTCKQGYDIGESQSNGCPTCTCLD